jgi:Berberine and berberine like/FAD binding domain
VPSGRHRVGTYDLTDKGAAMDTQAQSTIHRDDPRYPTMVRGFNQRFVGNPAYVEVVNTAEQACQAVQRCLDSGKRPVVRSGGHCYEGWSSLTDGAIIDISQMNDFGKRPDGKGFMVEAGCTNWDLTNGLYRQFGVAVPGGSCYSVGAGGHICGGGYGLLSRTLGLTVDWLDAVQVVVVRNGVAELVTVGKDSPNSDERDLFWAHTGGGGGNFGLITRYYFRPLPPAPGSAWWSTIAWNWSDLIGEKDQFDRLVSNFAGFFAEHSAPGSRYDTLFALLHLTQVANGQISVAVQQADADDAPLNEFIAAMTAGIDSSKVPTVAPIAGIVGHRLIRPTTQTEQMPWLEITQSENSSGPNRRGKYKSAYMKGVFPQSQLDTMWQWLTTDDYPQSRGGLIQVDSYGCEINTVASHETAIPQRSSIMKLQYQTYWTDQHEDDDNLAWIRGLYTDMYGEAGPRSDMLMDGCYVNYPDGDLVNWAELYYGANYARLRRAKTTWDPKNKFNHAQSIQPL